MGSSDRILAFPVDDGVYEQIRGIEGKVLFSWWPIEGSLNQTPAARLHTAGHRRVGCLRFRRSEAGHPGGRHDRFRGLHGRQDADLSHGQPAALAARRRQAGQQARIGAQPAERLVGSGPAQGWRCCPGPSGPRCIATPGGCSATSSGARTCRTWTGSASIAAIGRWWVASPAVAEFSDLMWEMQGELGTSHAYEFGGDYKPEPSYDQGFLAADCVYDDQADGYRITHIVRGDPWEEDGRFAVARAGAEHRRGRCAAGRRRPPVEQRADAAAGVGQLCRRRGAADLCRTERRASRAR